MRVPDTNLLLYAINPDSPCRDAAQQCLNEAAQSSEGMGLTWIGLLAFLRLTTRPPVLRDKAPSFFIAHVGRLPGWLSLCVIIPIMALMAAGRFLEWRARRQARAA